MNREIYTTDGTYKLIKLDEQDKDNYIELLRETSTDVNLLEKKTYVEMIWRFTVEISDNINYSIFDEHDEYCGNVVLQDVDSETPEIGVDLMKSKRNQGIAAKALKLLAKKSYENRPVEFYLIKVSSLNPHSRHMIEKLGAAYVADEESFIEKAIRRIEKSDKVVDTEALLDSLRAEQEKKPEVVHIYKWMPETFLV